MLHGTALPFKQLSNMADTGFKFPSTTGFSVQGNTWNDWTNPTNAYADDGVYATRLDNVGTHCQTYGNFSFGIPSGASVVGIEIKTKGKTSAGIGYVEFRYGYDRTSDAGGTNYVPASWWSTSDAVDTQGGASNSLGCTSATQMDNGNFYFRIKAATSTGNTLSLDYVQVKVYYVMGSGNFIPFFFD